jgi:hypothetical protein
LSGILPSQVAKKAKEARSQESGVRRKSQKRKTKNLNHRGHRGAQRKNLFGHRFSLIGTDLRAKPKARSQKPEGKTKNGKPKA